MATVVLSPVRSPGSTAPIEFTPGIVACCRPLPAGVLMLTNNCNDSYTDYSRITVLMAAKFEGDDELDAPYL